MTMIMPAEWAEQDWIWIGFPAAADLWEADLAPAQGQIAAFANAVAESGQEVRLVVRDEATASQARALVSESVKLEQHPYGDIWLRDTGPIIVAGNGKRAAQRFGFNGWGEKYLLEGDQDTGLSLTNASGLEDLGCTDWILEGGALDTDGTGLLMTTEQCLLNPNRNPALSRQDIEARLASDLGLNRILWLGDGLKGDHTDGHVDNLARFVGPGRIAIPSASGFDDPNVGVYDDAAQRAEAFGLEVVRIPSPGFMGEGEEAEPASYMNFVIANSLVVVPTYGSGFDDAAIAEIGKLFPDRTTIGLPSNAILTGGGSFHCCSCHVPKVTS